MKNIHFFPILFIMILCVSCKSKEEKALELINDYMFSTLYDYESYQPIETSIDSAFLSPYTDSICIAQALMAVYADEKADEYEETANSAKMSMDIWEDSYSSYGRTQFKKALSEYKDAANSRLDMLYTALECSVHIYERADTLSCDFCGWKVSHKFRCKTKGGNPSIGDYTFIVDPKFTKIISSFDDDDDDIVSMRTVIERALEADENTIQDIKSKIANRVRF